MNEPNEWIEFLRPIVIGFGIGGFLVVCAYIGFMVWIARKIDWGDKDGKS